MEKNKEKKITKKRKLNYQKIFCFISFIFILICILWYGGRFVYFYLDSKKTITKEATTFARVLKNQNHDKETLRQINQTYYFYGDVTNNYVRYSNLLWRVVKINRDNTVVLISDHVIGTLAYGDKNTDYKNSNLIQWLNITSEDISSGKLEKALHEKNNYLVKTSTCADNISDLEKITCEKKENEFYLGLLSLEDYVNTGGSKSFINNERTTYLANKDEENNIWYVNTEGKLDTTDGEEILGIKAVISLSSNLNLESGSGTESDPYLIEKNPALVGGYVELDGDVWQIYEEENELVKLILQEPLKEEQGDNNLTYNYSKNSYYHNDTIYGSLAYYLNHTYYNSLSYKDLIIENTYANGFYTNNDNYQIQNIDSNTIETKIALPSIGDILWDDTLDGYFTDTGLSKDSSLVYVRKEKGFVSNKKSTAEAYIVPCISIQKENLKTGSGSVDDPYRME